MGPLIGDSEESSSRAAVRALGETQRPHSLDGINFAADNHSDIAASSMYIYIDGRRETPVLATVMPVSSHFRVGSGRYAMVIMQKRSELAFLEALDHSQSSPLNIPSGTGKHIADVIERRKYTSCSQDHVCHTCLSGVFEVVWGASRWRRVFFFFSNTYSAHERRHVLSGRQKPA